MSSGPQAWKWTERDEYRAECETLSGDSAWVDIVKTAIEDNVLLDPVAGSKALLPEGHPRHDPNVRYVTVEEAPGLGSIPALIVVFRIEPPSEDATQPREVTAQWIEEGLESRTCPSPQRSASSRW